MRNFIGIDNGTTGSIGIITEDKSVGYYAYTFLLTPIKKEQSYTKTAQIISRVDHDKLTNVLGALENLTESKALIERPVVNPKLFKTTMSAMRSLESEQIVLEKLGIPYEFIDSKEWQGKLLPKGTKGTPQLKSASKDIGSRLFPKFKEEIEHHGDADGILIAEYCKLKS